LCCHTAKSYSAERQLNSASAVTNSTANQQLAITTQSTTVKNSNTKIAVLQPYQQVPEEHEVLPLELQELC
jgi:hypothetical protein